MTALLIENFKLVLLAFLIGSIIGLSHSSAEPRRMPLNWLHRPRRTASARA